uniref:Uncharacterized protein n=1 Tax=Noctiluca scintillans TaxID=2966 RepID=A0A7S1FDA5_NOCSC
MNADGGPAEPPLQKAVLMVVEGIWQYAYVGVVLFAFYEDRALCSCGVAGYVALFSTVIALELLGFAPTRGLRLWDTAIPICGSLAVVTSVACRLMALQPVTSAVPLYVCAVLCSTVAAITALAVRFDKESRARP